MNPTMADKEARIASFCWWPSGKSQTPEQLASAGFFFTGAYSNLPILFQPARFILVCLFTCFVLYKYCSALLRSKLTKSIIFTEIYTAEHLVYKVLVLSVYHLFSDFVLTLDETGFKRWDAVAVSKTFATRNLENTRTHLSSVFKQKWTIITFDLYFKSRFQSRKV